MDKTSKQPTIKDIAILAGTSLATVSWVLNGSSRKYVSPELRERVLDAARVLNYQPNLIAQRLRGKSRKMIAIIVPQFENIFFNHIVIGAEKLANHNGYQLLICSTDDNPEKELEMVNQLIANWVDGILLIPTYEGAGAINTVTRAGIPLVLLDRQIGTEFDFVGMDNYTPSYRAIRYLLEKGHRRIAYIGWDTPLHTLIERNKGFMQAMSEFNIADANQWIQKCQRNPEAGYTLAKKVLNLQPTAIFIDQNTIAEGVVKAIRDSRYKIPEDISVVIYGEPVWAVMNIPEFTCITLPDYRIGAEGAQILIDKIEGKTGGQNQVIHLLGKITERGSVNELAAKEREV
ncbi:MAG TPA: LacI family DNA-binding transcriptional regulator [Bacillota bacterium]|nr:LacI family DNA-binding transcriptional regulator [Bacillota bacterium]